MDTDRSSWWRQLNVVVIGGGLGQFAFGALASIVLIINSPANQLVGGLATAISLRQAGHRITNYEQADYTGDSGSSTSCGANRSQWLECRHPTI